MSLRRWGVVCVAVGLLCFAALAWADLPWQTLPSGVPPVPVNEADYFTADQLRSANDFAGPQRLISLSGYAVSLMLLAVLGFSRLGTRLVTVLPGHWSVQTLLAVGLVNGFTALLTLPFDLVLRARLVAVGLSTQSIAGWFRDWAVQFAIGWVTTGLAVLGLIALIRWLPQRWPPVAGVCAAALIVLGSIGYPVVIEPLFNKFTSLPDGPLRSQVLELAQQEGVAIDDVLVADASRRTTSLNAYVTGIGSTRRVVLYDTSVTALPRDELISIVAHELAHVKHHDVLTGTLLGASGSVVGMGMLALLLPGLRRRQVAGEATQVGATSVPQLLALLALVTLLASPIQQGISRQMEGRADLTALEFTKDPGAFIAMQRELTLTAHAQPDPPTITHFWFGSHPTAVQRIAMAEALRAQWQR